MIISRTPLRISFVGGGSDIASFYRKQEGGVVSTTIDKYVYIAVNRQFDGRILVNYSKAEVVTKISDIENNLVREAFNLTGVDGGIHVTSISDIPSEGSGMGSSSSYIVGLLNALYAYQGKFVTAERLAQEACRIEIDILKKPIGKQDQYIAAYGGFQYIRFNNDESVYVDPIICSSDTKSNLERKLMLFYTHKTRSADPILEKQTKNLATSEVKRRTMGRMVKIAQEMRETLRNNNTHSFGKQLHENWLLKRKMAEGVTNEQIDKWYSTALKNGAVGGKILGAGGGGFLLFFAPLEKHDKIVSALPELKLVDFKFEPQGSKIILIG